MSQTMTGSSPFKNSRLQGLHMRGDSNSCHRTDEYGFATMGNLGMREGAKTTTGWHSTQTLPRTMPNGENEVSF